MSEVTFAKTFLATLDKRPIKLPADHVSDPRKYPSQSPYILPRNAQPFPKHDAPTSTQLAQAKAITATLKPMRGASSVTLSDITLDSTIHDLKTQYAQQTSQPLDKIKLLLNKKPAADLKTLKDLGVDGDVELSVMIMSGAAATSPAVEKSEPAMPAAALAAPPDKMDVDAPAPAPESEKTQASALADVTSAAKTETAAGILMTEEFWADLKGFVTQKLGDETEGEKLVGVFREAWRRG